MVNLCCILNCQSRTAENRKKYSLFSIPKDENISNEWKQAISKVNGKPASLAVASHVCELHFGPNDICRSFSVWNNETVEDRDDFCINKKKPKLNQNVIPTIFDKILNEQQIKSEDLNDLKKSVKEDLKMINLVYPLNASSIERAVIAFSGLNICIGGPESTNFPEVYIKMLRSVLRQLYRHKSSSVSENIITTIKSGNSCRITLSDPKTRNTLSIVALQHLIEEIKSAGDDLSLKSIVICGDGPVFSAGHNLKELSIPENQKSVFSLSTKLMNTIIDCPIPIIACVDGIAAASGCQLVAASDMAICSSRSSFSTPGVNIGLFCSTPGIPLARVVSKKTAAYMLFTGTSINAEEALRTGLVSKVVLPEKLDDEITKLTLLVGQKSRAVITLGKTFFHRQIDENIKLAYRNGEQIMLDNLKLDDCKEGLQSFVEKRKPNWLN
ncbi:hypothetical protein ACI65C_002535 [Semiaphis heraclei]